ncbi:MAG: dTDP-glucose 4,6-dehydratase [Anaerolineales bacterium]
MKNILITGGAGFIGSNLVPYLLANERSLQLVNLDALTYAGNLENLQGLTDPSRHVFIEGDIRDQPPVESILSEYQIDTIVHLAAETHVDRSILGPSSFLETNIMGTFTLLEAARKIWEPRIAEGADGLRFHHVSTDEVYGSLSNSAPPFTETSRYDPRSPYAASKGASDHLVRSYAHTYSLPITIRNCSNNYGPRQFPEKLIPLIITNAVEGLPLPVYGDGQQIRDWIYVDDHSAALLAILKDGRLRETYNVGGNSEITNLEIVERVCRIVDELQPDSGGRSHARLIQHVADRPGHDRRYAMDASKMRDALDWTPSESLETGLRKTVAWYLKNPEWIASIRNRSSYSQWIHQN